MLFWNACPELCQDKDAFVISREKRVPVDTLYLLYRQPGVIIEEKKLYPFYKIGYRSDPKGYFVYADPDALELFVALSTRRVSFSFAEGGRGAIQTLAKQRLDYEVVLGDSGLDDYYGKDVRRYQFRIVKIKPNSSGVIFRVDFGHLITDALRYEYYYLNPKTRTAFTAYSAHAEIPEIGKTFYEYAKEMGGWKDI